MRIRTRRWEVEIVENIEEMREVLENYETYPPLDRDQLKQARKDILEVYEDLELGRAWWLLNLQEAIRTALTEPYSLVTEPLDLLPRFAAFVWGLVKYRDTYLVLAPPLVHVKGVFLNNSTEEENEDSTNG